jgi:hypothetical protein
MPAETVHPRTGWNYFVLQAPRWGSQQVVLSATEEDAVDIRYGHDPLETLTQVTIDDLLLLFIPVGNRDNIEVGGIIRLRHLRHRLRPRCGRAI